jgi:hypothetical protein
MIKAIVGVAIIVAVVFIIVHAVQRSSRPEYPDLPKIPVSANSLDKARAVQTWAKNSCADYGDNYSVADLVHNDPNATEGEVADALDAWLAQHDVRGYSVAVSTGCLEGFGG